MGGKKSPRRPQILGYHQNQSVDGGRRRCDSHMFERYIPGQHSRQKKYIDDLNQLRELECGAVFPHPHGQLGSAGYPGQQKNRRQKTDARPSVNPGQILEKLHPADDHRHQQRQARPGHN